MSRLAVVMVIGLGCGSVGSGEADATRRCEKVREHLVELQLADASTSHRDAHRKAMRNALGDDFIARCKASMTSEHTACVLGAATQSSARQCKLSAR